MYVIIHGDKNRCKSKANRDDIDIEASINEIHAETSGDYPAIWQFKMGNPKDVHGTTG